MKLYSVFRANDPGNLGDSASDPFRYFDTDVEKNIIDLWEMPFLPKEGTIIAGGGGLLGHPHFMLNLKTLLSDFDGERVFWGGGHNEVFRSSWRRKYPASLTRRGLLLMKERISYPRIPRCIRADHYYKSCFNLLSKFTIVGTRDYNTRHKWVPCVSCMHPAWIKYRSVKPLKKAVAVEHPHVAPIRLTNIDKVSSQSFRDLSEIAAFLSNYEFIITTSYHVAFWSTLLGRKTAVIPWSTKFYMMRHQPAIIYGNLHNVWADLEAALPHVNALEECQIATINFAASVSCRLNIEIKSKT